MIDLTPLDVRTKAGDFRRIMRGYDPAEVDSFLGLVAERLEELVRETLTLRERSERLHEQLVTLEQRERAVQDALVTAQKLGEDLRAQAEREAALVREEAQAAGRRDLEAVDRALEDRRRSLEEVERRRLRFLKAFRTLLQRELDAVEVEEQREPLEDTSVDLELGGGRRVEREATAGFEAAEATDVEATDPGPSAEGSAPPGEGAREATEAVTTDGGGETRDSLWLSSILKEQDEREAAEGKRGT